jgi:hypothetical protein
MPINPIPQPVDVIINPSGEPPKIKDFIINAPLIVQSTNIKNKLDTITKETDNLSTRLSALESSIDSNITNISSNASGSFFFSNSPNIIETSGSLYLSGAVKSSYISSSTGAYITGSVTQGYSGNIASGDYSHAEGSGTISSGSYSHAEGISTLASGEGSHAEGREATAYGTGSHAEGRQTTASGSYSHAEGREATASGSYSHAEGYSTTASGPYSHAEGYYTKIESTGLYAHAEGYLTTGSGRASHAEGYVSVASGDYSHAEGTSFAMGTYSHAEGNFTYAVGGYSHAGGRGTIASGSHQTVVGEYNKRFNTISLFAIGNGTGDSDAFRNDIFRAESTGELVLSGGIRQNARFITSTFGGQTHNLTRNDYIFILYTAGNTNTVYLPKITNTVTDIGLTVIIRQHDAVNTSVGVTIRSHTDNADYVIIGFDSTGTSIITNAGGANGTPNRSVTLTFVGTIPANGAPGTWVVISNSLC